MPGMVTTTYFEYFKSCNVENADEESLWMFGGQGFAAPLNQPLEQPVEDGLAEGADGKEDLVFGSALSDELMADLDFGLEQIPIQVVHIKAQNMAHGSPLLQHKGIFSQVKAWIDDFIRE